MYKQLGISLIEVLISIMILGLGLLGLGALQTRAVIMNQSSYYRSIAADLSADLSDRIRANRTPYLASVDADIATPLPPDFSKCTQDTNNKNNVTCSTQNSENQSYLVSNEMNNWNQYLRSQLPDSSYVLTATASQSTGFFRYNLTINWVDNRSKTTSVDLKIASYSTVIE